MSITSIINAVKSPVSEIRNTNLGDLSGRAVTFIKSNALLFGIGCIAALAIGILCYFRSKPDDNQSAKSSNAHANEQNKIIEPIKLETPVRKSQIIGSRLHPNGPLPENGTGDRFLEGQNIFALKKVRSYPLGTLHSGGIALNIGYSWNTCLINHTQHKINLRYGNSLPVVQEIYLDGFQVFNENAEGVDILPFENRPDLICIQKSKKPRKLIVLEKVKEDYIISWMANAEDFGVRVEDQPHNFEFSIEKIDRVNFQKNICPLLLFAANDENSAFAVFPKEIIMDNIAKAL